MCGQGGRKDLHSINIIIRAVNRRTTHTEGSLSTFTFMTALVGYTAKKMLFFLKCGKMNIICSPFNIAQKVSTTFVV